MKEKSSRLENLIEAIKKRKRNYRYNYNQQNGRNGRRISGLEDTTEEIESMVKENIKAINIITQNATEIWATMKGQNLRIIRIEERKDMILKAQ